MANTRPDNLAEMMSKAIEVKMRSYHSKYYTDSTPEHVAIPIQWPSQAEAAHAVAPNLVFAEQMDQQPWSNSQENNDLALTEQQILETSLVIPDSAQDMRQDKHSTPEDTLDNLSSIHQKGPSVAEPPFGKLTRIEKRELITNLRTHIGNNVRKGRYPGRPILFRGEFELSEAAKFGCPCGFLCTSLKSFGGHNRSCHIGKEINRLGWRGWLPHISSAWRAYLRHINGGSMNSDSCDSD